MREGREMSFFRRNKPEPAGSTFQMRDISAETFGKYQHCTGYEGVMYADSDFESGYGRGKPKIGAIPSPSEKDRTPFGQKRLPVKKESEEEIRARRERERAETAVLIEQQAAELVPEIESEQKTWFEDFVAEHDRDVAGYAFDCRRHGSFLTVFVTRKSNPTDDHPLAHWGATNLPQELATTLNLGLVKEIKFLGGHPPDLSGSIQFGFHKHYDSGGSGIGTGDGTYPAEPGSRWEVIKPSRPWMRGRPLVEFDPPPDKDAGRAIYMEDYRYQIRTTVERAARLAKDDTIRFIGLGATIHAPFGLGDQVHNAILKALE